MKTRFAPARTRRMLAAITAALIGISGSVALSAPAVASAAPAVTVTQLAQNEAPEGFSVAGSGFLTEEPVRVALVTEADWTASGAASTAAAETTAVADADGAFTTVIEAPAGALDASASYGIATSASVDRAYDTFTPVVLTPADAPEEAPATPEQAAEELAPEEQATELDVEAAPQQLSRTAAAPAASTVAPGNVTGGSVSWGLSAYLNSTNPGRPNPLPSAYVAPASISGAISTWGGAIGTVNPDGSAALAFGGTSVNFAPTGGGWLRLSDLEATLDAAGNGAVTAAVSYGTAVGTYPITYVPTQEPARGPQRVTLVTLAGNAVPPVTSGGTATWSGLVGSWSPEFTSFLAGDSGAGIPAWAYASTVSAAAGRTALPFTFSVGVQPAAVATDYDLGSAQWGLSTYLNSTNPGRPNPLPSAYLSPASIAAGITTWAGGSGTVKSDGTALLSYRGTSVNFASTGGGWLKLTDLQAALDASGNGVVSAIASYGTAVGSNPIRFDPAQPAVNGPTRVNLVNLSGNATPVSQGAGTASWSGLLGTWSPDFTAFLSGSGVTTGWAYASTVSSAAGRTPLPFSFQLGTKPPAVATSVALAVAPSASVVSGTPVTLTATVAPAAAGTVEFRDGSVSLGTAPVNSGVATLGTAALAVGDRAVTAYFTPADLAAFAASQSVATTISVTVPVVAQSGSLIWGVKSSFQSYVLGGGSISTSAGAGAYGSSFLFPQDSASFDHAGGTGASAYRGAVTFSYPGRFTIVLSNPRVSIDSATVGSLIVDVTYDGRTTAGVNFATLFLGAAAKSSGAGSTTFGGVPAALTSAGSAAFQGFYSAGDALDPVTFVVGSPAASFASTTASAPAAFVPPAVPPATEGVQVDPKALASLTEGGSITITASGFQPGETGIHIVIYSTPVDLGTTTADAQGVVTWTGRLPAGLTGSHTLTVQGSVSRGIVIDIAPRVTTAAEGCPVDGGTLTWGFKESFRSYISGSIANGEWTVADGATYTTPQFGWSGAQGAYDAEGGLVAFPGSVTFTGHGGVLNTTIANPQLRFIDDDTAVLLLDVSGTTQDGAAVEQPAVEFVEIDLSGAVEQSDGMLTVTDAPTALTAAGAAAFGTYPEGEAFDPLSFTLETECATAMATEEPTETAPAVPSSSHSNFVWSWILVGIVLVIVVAAIVVIMLRRRRAS